MADWVDNQCYNVDTTCDFLDNILSEYRSGVSMYYAWDMNEWYTNMSTLPNSWYLQCLIDIVDYKLIHWIAFGYMWRTEQTISALISPIAGKLWYSIQNAVSAILYC